MEREVGSTAHECLLVAEEYLHGVTDHEHDVGVRAVSRVAEDMLAVARAQAEALIAIAIVLDERFPREA